ncbi:hypothetical protein HK105_209163 [Polyrhizophydium stewartii]|uniref:G-protein coupled receptors family 2 profile 2 domain-containing protein n=1 Tax=Polyrhizophydium stewartii TaxID=2732419 RepID=A0ABR4MVT8_9FUNG|nr:hypothetical protein HK105_005079 [Polyrhizophydium stewartii]
MGYTPEQKEAVTIVTKVSASMSLLGVGGIVYFYFTKPKWFSNSMGRLVLALAFADFVDGISKFVGRWAIEAGTNSFWCQAQASAIQTATLANICVNLVIALNMLYIVFFSGSVKTLQRSEAALIALCFVVPFAFTVPMFATPTSVGNMIGDSDFWCWIGSQSAIYQIWLFYFELWFVFSIQILAYFFTWYGLRRLQGKISSATNATARSSHKYNTIMVKRMMAYSIAFMISWGPPTVNRMNNLATGQPIFALAVAQSTFSPLHGFINFCVFVYTRKLLKSGGSSGSGPSVMSPTSPTSRSAISGFSPTSTEYGSSIQLQQKLPVALESGAQLGSDYGSKDAQFTFTKPTDSSGGHHW